MTFPEFEDGYVAIATQKEYYFMVGLFKKEERSFLLC